MAHIQVFMLWEVNPSALGLDNGTVSNLARLSSEGVLLLATTDPFERDAFAREVISHADGSRDRRLVGATTLLVTDNWPIFPA